MPFLNRFKHHTLVECGCVVPALDNKPVPLKNVKATVHILDCTASVTIEQTYKNAEEKPIEVVYMFPMDDTAVITEFSTTLDGRVIKGEVKTIEEAKKEYEKAVSEKKSAFKLEEDKPDIFKVTIGNIPPGAEAVVKLTYASELTVEEDNIRFYLPTTIAPRYKPKEDEKEPTEQDKRLSEDLKTLGYSAESPCPLEINCQVEAASTLTSVSSPTHKISSSATSDNDKKKKKVWLSGHTTDMDRDFVLLIKTEETHQPRLIVEECSEFGRKSYAAMVTFVPSFRLPSLKAEIIFLIDRSGSMTGTKVEMAKNALKMFLKSLPNESYFNIVGFGSHFDSLFPTSVAYEEGTMTKAMAYVDAINADMGGTEILQPLKHIYAQKTVEGKERQVIVLTDGEVSNTSQVLQCIRENAKTARTFGIGLGSDCSHYLVNGIAAAGDGTAMFAALNERLEGKVQQTLQNALQPSMKGTTLSWPNVRFSKSEEKGATGDAAEVETEPSLIGFGKPKQTTSSTKEIAAAKTEIPGSQQIPNDIPAIFDSCKFIAYLLMDNSDVVPGEVKIQSQTPSGPLSLTLEAKQPIRSGNLIHKLAARAWIRDLEETRTRPGFEEFEKLVTALGLKYGLSSMFTSFVAVDQSGNTVHETMETRRIASQIPFGWGGFSQPIMMCSAPMMFGSMPMPLRGGGSGPDPAMDQDDMLCCNEMAPMPPPSGRAFSRKSAKMPEHEKNKKGSMKMNRKNKSESDEEAEGELTEAQKLQVIVDTQKFNGSFPINNSRLLQLFGLKDEKEVVEGAKTLNLSAEVYITLLSMEYLKSHLASFEEEWKLMAKKTEAWILQQKGITEEIRAKIKIDLQKKLGVQ